MARTPAPCNAWPRPQENACHGPDSPVRKQTGLPDQEARSTTTDLNPIRSSPFTVVVRPRGDGCCAGRTGPAGQPTPPDPHGGHGSDRSSPRHRHGAQSSRLPRRSHARAIKGEFRDPSGRAHTFSSPSSVVLRPNLKNASRRTWGPLDVCVAWIAIQGCAGIESELDAFVRRVDPLYPEFQVDLIWTESPRLWPSFGPPVIRVWSGRRGAAPDMPGCCWSHLPSHLATEEYATGFVVVVVGGNTFKINCFLCLRCQPETQGHCSGQNDHSAKVTTLALIFDLLTSLPTCIL